MPDEDAITPSAVVPTIESPVQAEFVLLHVSVPEGLEAWNRCPVRTGVPFRRGALLSKDNVRLYAGDVEIPCQTRILSSWDSGQSIKFLLVTFVAEAPWTPYTLRFGTQVSLPKYSGISVTETVTEIAVDNGILKVAIGTEGLIHSVLLLEQGRPMPIQLLKAGHEVQGYFVDQHDHSYRTKLSQPMSRKPPPVATVEEAGPIAAVVRISGWYQAVGPRRGDVNPLNQFVVRVYVYHKTDFIRLHHTFINTGFCEDYQYKQIGLDLPLNVPAVKKAVFGSKESGEAVISLSASQWAAVVQLDSSKRRTLKGKAGVSPSAPVKDGRIGNMVRLIGGKRAAAIAVRGLWQQHPSGFEASADGLVKIHFWSPHQRKLFDLRAKNFLENLKPGAYDEYRDQSVTMKNSLEPPPPRRSHRQPVAAGGRRPSYTLG